jgi:hypothetical protein
LKWAVLEPPRGRHFEASKRASVLCMYVCVCVCANV